MRLTKSRLKQIIKEELQSLYTETLTDEDKTKKKELEKELEDLEHK
mgnify:CR=1 FL=1